MMARKRRSLDNARIRIPELLDVPLTMWIGINWHIGGKEKKDKVYRTTDDYDAGCDKGL